MEPATERATGLAVAAADAPSHWVEGERLWRRLMELAQFGATPNGGVHRLALSAEEIAARAQLVAWGTALGLAPANDAAGNLFLRLRGKEPELPPVLVGSHIDTQPSGGKFDGAYGVIAALEALEAIISAGQRPRRCVDIVAWMNEEGARFAPGMMGSAVFAGKRSLEEIKRVKDSNGVAIADALAGVLAAEQDLPRRPLGFPAEAFIEAHIEQGVVLERHGTPIGIVIGLQGKRTFLVEVVGEEAHAGTTPRSTRRDALVSAVDIIKSLEAALWDDVDTVRFTIGRLVLQPNVPSVVPGRATFSIDLRHNDTDVIRDLGDKVPDVCARARGRCEVAVTQLLYDPPLEFPPAVRARLRAAAERAGLRHMELQSPAGHDSRYLHSVCPSGMIFIPCKDGISHNEAESITPSDAVAGVRVLADVVCELACE